MTARPARSKPKAKAKAKPKSVAMVERKAPAAPRWPVGEDGLTDRQRLFVAEVQVDWNYTQAAIRAGYSPASAKHTASDMMKNPVIQAAIEADNRSKIAAAGVSKAWVLKNLVGVHHAATRMEGVGALDRRLKALELIGRHRDVDAFRATGGPPVIPDGSGGEWDLTRLDDSELAIFERLLAKITADPGASPGGIGASDAGPGTPSDGDEPGSDPEAL